MWQSALRDFLKTWAKAVPMNIYSIDIFNSRTSTQSSKLSSPELGPEFNPNNQLSIFQSSYSKHVSTLPQDSSSVNDFRLDQSGLRSLSSTVPCFDTAIQSTYHTACTVTNPLGASDSWRTSPNALFTCDGNVPGIYWNTLLGLGIATCVCGYIGSAGNPWVFQNQYGNCNGACTADTFSCDGTNIIVGNRISTTLTTPYPGPTPTTSSTRPITTTSIGVGAKYSKVPVGLAFPLIVALNL